MKNSSLFICLSFFILLTFPHSASAHQDFWITKDYSNVKIRITTGYNYEEIRKVKLIAQLAEKLSKKLDYNKQIFLDFDHHYTSYCEPDFFIAFDKGQLATNWEQYRNSKKTLKSNGIVIRQVARIFDAKTTLQLIEYAILNIEFIKKNQTVIKYNQNYNNWKLNSIDTNLIDSVLLLNSNSTTEVLNDKVYNSKIKNCHGISYYLQDNQYTIFNSKNEKETLLKVNNVYNIACIEDIIILVFDTDSSFYIIDLNSNAKPKYKIFENKNKSFAPPSISLVENSNDEKVIIWLPYYLEPESIIYDMKTDTLIYLED